MTLPASADRDHHVQKEKDASSVFWYIVYGVYLNMLPCRPLSWDIHVRLVVINRMICDERARLRPTRDIL